MYLISDPHSFFLYNYYTTCTKIFLVLVTLLCKNIRDILYFLPQKNTKKMVIFEFPWCNIMFHPKKKIFYHKFGHLYCFKNKFCIFRKAGLFLRVFSVSNCHSHTMCLLFFYHVASKLAKTTDLNIKNAWKLKILKAQKCRKKHF